MSNKPDGWVARDKYESPFKYSICFFTKKPVRDGTHWVLDQSDGSGSGGEHYELSEGHPIGKGLTWEDDPRPVYLTPHSQEKINDLVDAANEVIESCRRCGIADDLKKALEPFTEVE
jgi:hypothetical protein